MTLKSLDEYESMSAEAFDMTHPFADKLITLLKSARGYRKALDRIAHLKDVQGERWATSSARYYERMLVKVDDQINTLLTEINPVG